ncbi:MAG TPA: cupin domain-containing protein [Pyrinomonadaceae bacterium]|jgi:quercetin dioxygenase-like cupin family protein|nr:cupin domain-containing protein [Pyrinomonadaceae bacterium]
MSQAKVDFKVLPWEETAVGARSKAFVGDGKKLRLVEFTEEFVEHEWCLKSHTGYVLEGEMEITFDDGTERLSTGDGIFIAGGERQRHRARVAAGSSLRLILVEDAE